MLDQRLEVQAHEWAVNMPVSARRERTQAQLTRGFSPGVFACRRPARLAGYRLGHEIANHETQLARVHACRPGTN